MASEPGDGDLHDEVKTVTINIYSSHEAAGLAAANLEAHGIECWVNADDCGGMYPNLTAPGGVRLSVRASDAEAAIALLNTQASPSEINQIEIEAVSSAPPETAPLKKLSLWQILSGIVMGIILCLFFQWANDLGTKTYYHYARNHRPDEAWTYQNGHLIEYKEDRNLDGKWDHWAYYQHGQVVRSEYDNNFDGKPDYWWTFSDDGTDTSKRDADFNGIPDEFCIYKNRMLQQLDIKPNGSKFTTVREIFKNGVLTEILRGGDSKGHFKEDVKYDPFFNPIPIGFNPVGTNIPTTFQLLTPSK
ncbi:MAG: hypothetical protein ACREDS_04620 [Limisphaerales bacterium]